MPSVIVYTAVFGNYDTLRDQPRNDKVDYRCYSDNPQPSNTWAFIKRKMRQRSNAMAARQCKILAHHLILDCQYSIWLDANDKLWDDPIKICKKWLASADMAVFKHPHRKCIYDEVEACIKRRKDDPDTMRRQVARYRAEGYPRNNGLNSTGVLIRRHTKKVAQFNDAWWEELLTGSHRDQLSFPYMVWKTGMKIQIMPGNSRVMTSVPSRLHIPYKGK